MGPEDKQKQKETALEMMKSLANMNKNFQFPAVPPLRDIDINPAKRTYERLGKYIKEFESNLDTEHEIGACLVSFGQVVTFHIQDISYWGPDIITFRGIKDDGERVQLIQHITQLNVLLIAVRKIEDQPKRIGFILDDKQLNGDA